MKKVMLLLLLFVLLLGSFSFAGCQDLQKIDIARAVTKIEAYEDYTEEGHFWFVFYYVDPALCDLSTVNSVEIKTYITVRSNTGNDKGTYQKNFTATIPDDVAPTAENNYVMLQLDGKKYKVDSHLILLECYAFVIADTDVSDGENTEPGTEGEHSTIPSIFNTFVIGVVIIIGGLVAYWIALVLIRNKIVIAIVFIIPILMVITSYFAWGLVRGIILTVCYGVYYFLLAMLNKRIGEEL